MTNTTASTPSLSTAGTVNIVDSFTGLALQHGRTESVGLALARIGGIASMGMVVALSSIPMTPWFLGKIFIESSPLLLVITAGLVSQLSFVILGVYVIAKGVQWYVGIKKSMEMHNSKLVMPVLDLAIQQGDFEAFRQVSHLCSTYDFHRFKCIPKFSDIGSTSLGLLHRLIPKDRRGILEELFRKEKYSLKQLEVLNKNAQEFWNWYLDSENNVVSEDFIRSGLPEEKWALAYLDRLIESSYHDSHATQVSVDRMIRLIDMFDINTTYISFIPGSSQVKTVVDAFARKGYILSPHSDCFIKK
ncbi:MAG: hypothetical protein WC222_07445 [Parachlamydiales bacterium]|jgi:hypothetical protein